MWFALKLHYIPLTTSRLRNVHTLATQCDTLVLTSSLILLAEHGDGKANRIINRAGGSIPLISAIRLPFLVVTFMADLTRKHDTTIPRLRDNLAH